MDLYTSGISVLSSEQQLCLRLEACQKSAFQNYSKDTQLVCIFIKIPK